MKAFAVHFAAEFRAGYADRSRLFMNYLFPLTVFLLLATLMTGVNPLFKTQMIPAMILFATMSSCLLFLSSSWIAQREAGIYRSFRINGVPARDILFAPAAATLAHLAVVSLLVVLLGHLVFGAPLPERPGLFLLGWLLSALALEGIAMAIGVTLADQRSGMLVSQFIFLPSILLGGLMMPADLVPRGLAALARVFPAPWAMEAMGGAGGPGASWLGLGVLGATALVGYLLARGLFEWNSSPSRPAAERLLGLLVALPALAGLGLRSFGLF